MHRHELLVRLSLVDLLPENQLYERFAVCGEHTSSLMKLAQGVSTGHGTAGWMGNKIEDSSSRCVQARAAFTSRCVVERSVSARFQPAPSDKRPVVNFGYFVNSSCSVSIKADENPEKPSVALVLIAKPCSLSAHVLLVKTRSVAPRCDHSARQGFSNRPR